MAAAAGVIMMKLMMLSGEEVRLTSGIFEEIEGVVERGSLELDVGLCHIYTVGRGDPETMLVGTGMAAAAGVIIMMLLMLGG